MTRVKLRLEDLPSVPRAMAGLRAIGAVNFKITATGHWQDRKTGETVFAESSDLDVKAVYNHFIRACVDGKVCSLLPDPGSKFSQPVIHVSFEVPGMTVERY